MVDPKAAHEEAMTDLENGVTSLWLRVEPDVDLDTVLDGVFLDLAPVVLDAGADALAVARGFVAYADPAWPRRIQPGLRRECRAQVDLALAGPPAP